MVRLKHLGYLFETLGQLHLMTTEDASVAVTVV
jgi:hypothetical protein